MASTLRFPGSSPSPSPSRTAPNVSRSSRTGGDAVELPGVGDRPEDRRLVEFGVRGALTQRVERLRRVETEIELRGEPPELCRLDLEAGLVDEPAVDEPFQRRRHPIPERRRVVVLVGRARRPGVVERRLQPPHHVLDVVDDPERDLGV